MMKNRGSLIEDLRSLSGENKYESIYTSFIQRRILLKETCYNSNILHSNLIENSYKKKPSRYVKSQHQTDRISSFSLLNNLTFANVSVSDNVGSSLKHDIIKRFLRAEKRYYGLFKHKIGKRFLKSEKNDKPSSNNLEENMNTSNKPDKSNTTEKQYAPPPSHVSVPLVNDLFDWYPVDVDLEKDILEIDAEYNKCLQQSLNTITKVQDSQYVAQESLDLHNL